MGPGTLVAERVKRADKPDGWKLYIVARPLTTTGIATLVSADGSSFMVAKTDENFAELVKKSDDWQVVDTHAVDILVPNALNKAIETGDGTVTREGDDQ